MDTPLHGLTPEYIKAVAQVPVGAPKENSSLLDRSLGHLLGAVPSAVEGVSKAAGTIAGFDGSFLDPKTEITPATTTGGKVVDFIGNLLPVAAQFAVGEGPVGAIAKATGLAKAAPVLTNVARQAAGFGVLGLSQDRTTGAEAAGGGGLIGATHALPLSARIPVGIGLGLLSKAIFESRHPEANPNVALYGTMAQAILHKRIGTGKVRPIIPDNFATVANGAGARAKFAAAAEQPVIDPITHLPTDSAPVEPAPYTPPPTDIGVGIPAEIPKAPIEPVVTSPSGPAEIPATPIVKEPIRPPLSYSPERIGVDTEPPAYVSPISPVGVPASLPRPEPVPSMPVPTLDPPPLVETAIEKAHRNPTNRPPLKYAAERIGEVGGIGGIKPNLPNPVLPADLKIDSILDQVIPIATRAAVGGAAGAIFDPEDRVGGALAGASIGIIGPKLVDMATELKPALKGKLPGELGKAKPEGGALGSAGGGGGMKLASPHDLVPALLEKGKTEPIIGNKGETHSDIKKRQPLDWRDTNVLADLQGEGARHGFWDGKRFLTREGASDKLGLKEPLQSETLRDLQSLQKPDMEQLAAANGYTIKGVRAGYYKEGIPLKPSTSTNFGAGYYIAEGDLSPDVVKNFTPKPVEGLEARAEKVYVNAPRLLRVGPGISAPAEITKLIDEEMLKQAKINEEAIGRPIKSKWDVEQVRKARGITEDSHHIDKTAAEFFLDETGTVQHDSGSAYYNALNKLIYEKKIPYDGLRVIAGRTTHSKLMDSEIVVQHPEQIKSATDNSGAFNIKSKDIRGAIIPELGSYMTRAAVGGIVGGLIGGHYDHNGDNGGFIAGALLVATAAAVGPEIALATIKKLGKAELPPPAKGLNEMGALKKTFEQRVEERGGAVIHGSTRVADRLVNWLDKSFNMTMPESVSRTLRVAEGTATHMLDTMDSAMRKLSVFYKAPQELKDAANKYLDGAITRDQFLQPLQTEADKTYANYVVAARESIDGLQRMLASGIGSDSKSKLINESLGRYVTRSYKLFTRDNWTPEPSTVDTLAQKLRSEKAWEGASDGEIKDYLYSYIREVNTTKGMYRGSSSKVGESIDQHVLKPREKLDPEWRAFLGEITNPAERISQTLYRLRPMSAASKFMHDIAVNMTEDGMPHYFQDRGSLDAFKAKTLQSLQNATDPAAKSSLQGMLTKLDNFQPLESLPKYGELRGGLVSRNVWNTLSTFDSVTGLGNHPLMRSVSGLNVAAKLSNTALNPISFVRNVFQIPMMMAIGRASMNDVYEGLKILHDPEHALRAEIISQGIGSVDQLKQEIFRDFNTATEGKYNFSNMDSSNLSLGRMDADAARKAFGKLSNKYLDIYRSPDNAVRIGTYLSSKRRIAEALGKDINDPIVLQKATDFTNRYTMDYGAVAPIIKNVRQIPGVNLYISYISEMTRITKNVMMDVIHGEGDGLTAHSRLYAAMPIAFLGVLPEVMNQQAEASLSPKDRSDWEKVKNLMPDYARTRYRASITRQADGNFKYVDFTSLMPTDFLHQTGKAAANGDWSAFRAVNPIVSLDNSPALNILVEQTSGEDVHTHREFRGFQDRVASVAKEITPPWLSIGREGKKFEQSHTPTETGDLGLTNLRTGQRLTPQDFWLPYETALRSGSYNLSALELQYTNEVKRDIANNSAYLNDILKSDASEEIKTREKLKFAKVQNQILSAWQDRLGLSAPK